LVDLFELYDDARTYKLYIGNLLRNTSCERENMRDMLSSSF
jgi:hypothetical protein